MSAASSPAGLGRARHGDERGSGRRKGERSRHGCCPSKVCRKVHREARYTRTPTAPEQGMLESVADQLRFVAPGRERAWKPWPQLGPSEVEPGPWGTCLHR